MTVHTETGLRDRKKQATRQALRAAALRLVADRGFAHVTVEDIAEAAEVAPRTFFNYFPSKEAAVLGIDPDRTERLRRALLDRPASESPLAAVRAVLVEHTRAMADEWRHFGRGDVWLRRFSAVRCDPDLAPLQIAHLASTERAFTEALAERLGTDPQTDSYPALVTVCAFAAMRVAAYYWSAEGGVDSLADRTAAAFDRLQNGLRVEHPR
jgi:AcrR family transcriptional regulator